MTERQHEALSWFDKAQRDIEMARRAMDSVAPLPDMACYHAQQCAEKCAKAFLTANNASFPFVHDVVYLVQLCQHIDPDFKDMLNAADILNEYSIKVRYPAMDNLDVTVTDAKDAITHAKQFSSFVQQRLG